MLYCSGTTADLTYSIYCRVVIMIKLSVVHHLSLVVRLLVLPSGAGSEHDGVTPGLPDTGNCVGLLSLIWAHWGSRAECRCLLTCHLAHVSSDGQVSLLVKIISRTVIIQESV